MMAAGRPVWFAFDETRPLAFFAGIWTRWTGVRKVNDERHLRVSENRAKQDSRSHSPESNAGHSNDAELNQRLMDEINLYRLRTAESATR
jgi:hypothetical protein